MGSQEHRAGNAPPAGPRSLDGVTLADLEFDNRFTAALPADPSDLNRPRQVHAAAYTRIRPTPVSRPRTIAVADEMLELIGLDRADAASPSRNDSAGFSKSLFV